MNSLTAIRDGTSIASAMSAKRILFEPQLAIARALERFARVIRPTLGPLPRTVLIGRQDGAELLPGTYEIAQELEFEDRFESTIALMVRDMVRRMRWSVGDGLATAVVLTDSLYRESVRHLAAGTDPLELQRELDAACRQALRELDGMARPVSGPREIEQIATGAADPHVGEYLASIAASIGKGTAVLVEESGSIATTHETIEGLQFHRGYVSTHFVTNPQTQEAVLENPLVLLSEKRIASIRQIARVLEHALSRRRPLLIVTSDIENEVIAGLLVNRLKSNLVTCAVKAMGSEERRRDLFEDLAAVTGAIVPVETDPAPEHLGDARRAVIDKEKSTVLGTRRPTQLIERLKRSLQAADLSEREDLQDRLLRLTGHVIIIKVGAPTPSELRRRKSVFQGALNAVRAAIEQGVVPGAGLALARLSKTLPSGLGGRILAHALLEPIRVIADNAGYDGRVVAHKVLELDRPFNALTGRFEGDFTDPKKVLALALQNACSLASVLLVSDAIVAETEKLPVVIPPGIEEIPRLRKELPAP